MNIRNDRLSIAFLAGFWGALLAQGMEPSPSGAQLESDKTPDLAGKYQAIIDRNPFNLQPLPPPPPPKKEEKPKEEPIPLEKLQLVLAGISGKSGEKRVWLAMTLPPLVPEDKPVQRFYSFRENEEQHGIVVKSIQSNGDVDIEYKGVPVLLTFETHGNKKKAPPKKQPPSKSNRLAANKTTSRYGNRTSPSRKAIPAKKTASPVGQTQTSSRPIRSPSPQQPQLSREEQIVLMRLHKAAAEQEGKETPPIPPIPLHR